MTNNETLKKYGLPLFFYVGDTFVNTCGSLVEIVEVEKQNLKIRGPSGTFDYKPLDILKRLVKKDYTSYKQATSGAMTTQTKKFNLPINEKVSKKLCHYINVEYSDDLRAVSIYNGKDINKRFARISVQNCSMEYIKAVLAELPDVDTTDIKPIFSITDTKELQKLASLVLTYHRCERLEKAKLIIRNHFSASLYSIMKGDDAIEKAKNFLNDRDIEFDCDNTVKETVSTLTPNKQKKFNNWVGNLKEATKKQRPEIKRTYLLSKLSNPSIIEFYRILQGINCGIKANILLDKWSIEWEAKKYPKPFQEAYRFKEEKVVKNQNEELNQDLLLLL